MRAPHKPLLLLLALAAVQRGESRLMKYDEIHRKLERLLRDFGPQRKSLHPEYPFWRLQNDGEFWDISEREQAIAERGERIRTGDVPPKVLRKVNAHGGFTPQVHSALTDKRSLVNDLVTSIIKEHFPASYHADLLNSVGMPAFANGRTSAERNPKFRDDIVRLYEHECAMCGFDGRLGFSVLALEAAHIMWHALGGPDEPNNGILLCSIHHKAFDRGAIGLTNDCRIKVSQHVQGGSRVIHLITELAGNPLKMPIEKDMCPAEEFIEWHNNEVFRGPSRPST
jgi:putative restriction endonuclease